MPASRHLTFCRWSWPALLLLACSGANPEFDIRRGADSAEDRTTEPRPEVAPETAAGDEALEPMPMPPPPPEVASDGGLPPDAGGLPPDAGGLPPDVGGLPPDAGGLPPDAGLPPDGPPGPLDGALEVPADTASPDVSVGQVASWPMEEGQGTTTEDSSGRGNAAVLVGVAWARPGAPRPAAGNACLEFDGTSHASASATGFRPLGTPITITFWMRPTLGARRTAIALVGPTGTGLAGVQLGVDARRAALWFAGDSTLVITTPELTSGSWYHVAYTFDGARHRLFLDGALAGSSTRASPTVAPFAFRFGYYGSLSQQLFLGQLDDVRVYDRPLTSAELLQLVKP